MNNIITCWLVTVCAIIGVFIWQFLSLFNLYVFDKEKFSNEINVQVHKALYEFNSLQTKYSTYNYVGVNTEKHLVLYVRGNKRDTLTIDPSISTLEATSRAKYDIHTPYWTLERLDSLVRSKSDRDLMISFILTDSTGKVIQSFGDTESHSNITITGDPVRLGFLKKHVLDYSFAYRFSLLDFIQANLQSSILLVTLFLFLSSCILSLFNSFRHAKKQNRMHDLFVSLIIHNLDSPLACVITTRQLLEIEIEPHTTKEVKELLNILRDEHTHMSETVSRLLNLSNTFNRIKVFKEEKDLASLMQDIIHYSKMIIPQDKVVTIKSKFNLDNPIVRIDANHFKEIIQNLIDNSIKYSGKKVQIEINCMEQGKNVMICVKDDGNGISPNNLKKIFKPYYRGNNTQEQGFGLGLAYVKIAVEAHGGHIAVNSQSQLGTEFIITIPR